MSPSGTGITYTASTARMIFGMQKNGTLPSLRQLHPVWGVPRPAMWLNLAVRSVPVLFPRLGQAAAVISVATIISYLTGPVSAAEHYDTAPNVHRPLRLPGCTWSPRSPSCSPTELLYSAKSGR